jgi:hypothetical protein
MTARRPDHLKLLSGTARRDRMSPVKPTLPALNGVPPAPSWLPVGRATTEWARLAPILSANRMLTDGNLDVLAHVCSLHAKLAQIWESDIVPTAALLNAYRGLMGELGLLSMKLPMASAEKPPNRFLVNVERLARVRKL